MPSVLAAAVAIVLATIWVMPLTSSTCVAAAKMTSSRRKMDTLVEIHANISRRGSQRIRMHESITGNDHDGGGDGDVAVAVAVAVPVPIVDGNPAECEHGYLSAADGSTCVCNSGWTGRRCEIDALPSCVRGEGNPCLGDLRFKESAVKQPCGCLTECVTHIRETMDSFFGPGGYNASALNPLIVHRHFLLCDSAKDLLKDNIVRAARKDEEQPLEHHIVRTDYHDCPADCSGAKGRRCAAHFCECPGDRTGAFCQRRKRAGRHLGTDDDLLTFQILEVPGSLLLDRISESLYQRRSDYWAPNYFLEQLLRDRSVLLDDNASVVIMPHMINPRLDAATWIASMQENGTSLPHLARPLADGERPILMWSAVYERWIRPRESDPKRSFHLQNTGLPDATGAQMDIALPLHDFKLMPDIREYRTASANGRSSIVKMNNGLLQSSSEAHRLLFNSSVKTIELFFVGRTRLDRAQDPSDPPPHCLDSRLFTSDPETCPCVLEYSECIRQYIFHNYRETPGMFIRDPTIEDVPQAINKSIGVPGHASAEYALSEEVQHAHFCLVSGGFNFDMRITSAIMSGCIPLWTFLEQVPPLPRILKHERILVRLTPESRPALAHLETLLQCYTPDVRKAMVANIEMTWPAFAWGSGTAYHHALLEIAALTGKQAPSAMAAILKVHGPIYVGEMLKVDLAPYASLRGMSKAIAFRNRLSLHDPLADLLQEVESCIAAIPGVGDPAAVQVAAYLVEREHRKTLG